MMKFKKILICASISLLTLPAFAKTNRLSCPFTDYFAVSAPGLSKIINIPVIQGNIKFTQQSDIFFTLSCGDDRSSDAGDLSIDVGYDDQNKCSLGIHDGPYAMNPSVTYVNCKGNIKYDGIDHVFGSYNYTLKFS